MKKLISLLMMLCFVPSVFALTLSNEVPTSGSNILGIASQTFSVDGDSNLSSGILWLNADPGASMNCAGVTCTIDVDLSSANEGDVINYSFDAINGGGWVSTSDFQVTIDRAPNTPTGVVIQEFNDSALQISWNSNSESDIDFYTVYGNESGSFVSLGTTDTTSFINNDLVMEIEYWYTVSATDVSVQESSQTTPENGKIVNNTAGVNVTVEDDFPYWNTLVTNPLSPVVYSPSADYEFSCSWYDDVSLSNVVVEIDGVNYTDAVNVSEVFTKTLSDLNVGSYSYVWFANDTSNQENVSSIGTLEVLRADPGLDLVADDWSVNAGIFSNVDCTVNAGSVVLERNGSVVSVPENKKLLPGTYTYNCSVVESSNYNDSEEVQVLTVNDVVLTSPNEGVHSESNPAPGQNAYLNYTVTLNPYEWFRVRMSDLVDGANDIQINEESQPVVACAEDFDGSDFIGGAVTYNVDNSYDTVQDALTCISKLSSDEVIEFDVIIKLPIPIGQVGGSYAGNIWFQQYSTQTE